MNYKNYFSFLTAPLLFSLLSTAIGAKLSTSSSSAFILRPTHFTSLPGWQQGKQQYALAAFRLSCGKLLQAKGNKNIGSAYIALRKHDWQAVCHAAKTLRPLNPLIARQFFVKWFRPWLVLNKKQSTGLVTGYYMPIIPGSFVRTKLFSSPIYARPKDLVKVDLGDFHDKLKGRIFYGKIKNRTLVPYEMSRNKINKGKLKKYGEIIAWTTPIDRFFLQIQGSGAIQINKQKLIYVGFDGHNGASYTAIGKLLIKRGVFTHDNISMQKISHWLQQNITQAKEVMEQNQSFVFFKMLTNKAPLGTQRVPLTAGRSLAVDQHYIPLGAPLWLKTQINNKDKRMDLERLVVAQDTGGAIKGVIRGDLYWGVGKNAEFIAGHMKSDGQYWLLLPKHVYLQHFSGDSKAQ